MDPAGNATALWIGAGSAIRVASKPAGGTWGQPDTIGSGEFASLAVDASGEATVVWDTFLAAGGSMVQTASRSSRGAWSQPVTLAQTPAPFYAGVEVAINPAGDAMAAWASESPMSAGPLQTAFRPAGGQWGAPNLLTNAADGSPIALASGARATAVWSNSGGMETASSRQGGPWNAPVTIAHPGGVYGLQLGANASGDTLAAWLRPKRSRTFYYAAQVQGTIKPANGQWQRAISFSRGVSFTDTGSPAVGVDAHGNAVVAWIHPVGTGWDWVIETATFTRHHPAARAGHRRR